MKLRILCVGNNMPSWVKTAVNEYSKRMPRDCAIELQEIAPAKRNKTMSAQKAMQIEAKSLEKAMNSQHHTIALDIPGKPWSTQDVANKLADWRELGKNIDFIIGGADGISPEILNRVQDSWSLSNLTLPHPLVRVMLTEQLYRAWTLLNHHPYHR